MLNKVMLIGNLGRDPELRYTANGTAVCNFTIATNERWRDRDNNQQERTEWHRIVVWGKQGENCSKYLQKGRKVFVEGRLQTRDWEDRDGNKRYTTEIVANSVQFLGGRGEDFGDGPGASGPSGPPAGGGWGGGDSGSGGGGGGGGYDQGISDDDIPF